MGKNQSASGLTNIIQYDNKGNVSFVSGSTTLMQISSSGAITTTGVISGSNALSSSYALNSGLLNGTGSVGFATTGSLLIVSSSQQQISASQQQLSSSFLILTASFNAVSSSQQQISASYIALSASYNTFSGSASTRITVDSASLLQVSSSQQQISASLLNVIAIGATTGSNSFRANQSITGSLVVSSTITAQTLIVQTVTSSIIYSSGSNLFGNQLANTQTFTGSVNITGSLALAGNITGNAITLTGALNGTSAVFSSTVTSATFIIDSTTGNDQVVFKNNGSFDWQIGGKTGDATQNFSIYNYATATRALFFDKSSNAATFTGNVGIGVSPTENLTIYGAVIRLQGGAGVSPFAIANNNSSGFRIYDYTAGVDRLLIASTGAATFTTNSNSTIVNSFQNTNTTNTNSRNMLNVTAGNVTLQFTAIHGDNVYISPSTAVSTYLGYNNTVQIASSGAATFSSSVTAGGLVTINKINEGLILTAGANTDASYMSTRANNSTGWMIMGSQGSAANYIQTGTGANESAITTVGAYALSIGTNQVERMRISSDGSMGFNNSIIGSRSFVFKGITSRPIVIEAVENAGVHSMFFRPNNSGYNLISSNYLSGGTYLPLSLSARENNGDLVLATNGNVGVGISAPSQKLHAVGGFLQTAGNSSWYRNVFERNVTSWDSVVGFTPQSNPQYTYGYINITASAYNNGTSAGGVVTSRWYYSITNNSISVSVVGSDIVTGSQAPMVRLLVTSGVIYVQVQSTNGSTSAYTTIFVDAMLASGYVNSTYWIIA